MAVTVMMPTITAHQNPKNSYAIFKHRIKEAKATQEGSIRGKKIAHSKKTRAKTIQKLIFQSFSLLLTTMVFPRISVTTTKESFSMNSPLLIAEKSFS